MLPRCAGVLEVFSIEVAGLVQQWELDPSVEVYARARMLLTLAATFNEVFLERPGSQAAHATWRWLLPACMEAASLAGGRRPAKRAQGF